jgi:iron complex transport system substrate-binding protein
MRIVSLLPSLTELVCALGRGDELVGVTHECDFPPGVELLPHLTRSKIPHDATSQAIDSMVAEQGGSLYELDEARLAELQPDLILTQEQCDVCAVNEATVRRMALKLPGQPTVESVNPTDLEGVYAMFRRVGELLDAKAAADAIIKPFETSIEFIDAQLGFEQKPPRVVILEWLDPPYSSGHWNPGLIARAGGREVIGKYGERSKRLTWEDVRDALPEIIIIAACGYSIERTEADLAELANRPEWQNLRAVRNGRVYVTDGSAYFSRPGPRLEASLRIAAAAIHPDLFDELAPRGSLRHVPARI